MIPNIQLSKDVWLYDYLKSDIAERFPYIQEQQFNPTQDIVDNLKRFNAEVDQPIMDLWPLRRTSTYRCEALNIKAGGSATSAHMFGRAGDREPLVGNREGIGEDYRELILQILDKKIPFDKMILEYGTLKQPAWLHLQVNIDPKIYRRQILRVGAETKGAYILFDVKNWRL